ncbi:hypothetical protein ACF0H5_015669 [Mactra antiquata]
MVPSQNEQMKYKLSKADRRSLEWNQTGSRRDTVPQYQNTLSQVDQRLRICETCGQWFDNIDDMKKHVELTHTGSKPVVCELCGKRFSSTQHMVAHYQKHREARLQEFAILKKRRQADIVSESESSSAVSFNKAINTLKSYKAEPYHLPKSYGTEQSYNVSRKHYHGKEEKLPLINGRKSGKQDSTNQPTRQVGTLPMIKGSAVNTLPGGKENLDGTTSVIFPSLGAKRSVPGLDPERISVIDNVMGVNKTIETSEASGFVQNAEDALISSRMEAVALAGNSSSPRSFVSKTASSDLRKPQYMINKEFWETGSHVTDTRSGYTTLSGYDRNYRGNQSGSIRHRKITASLPSIR